MAFAWSGLFVACLCSLTESVHGVCVKFHLYIVFYIFYTGSYMLGLLSPTSNVMFNLSCFLVLVKVYDVFPWLMYGQVRQPCLESKRNVLAGSFGFLSSFASFARTSRSRRFAEHRTKAKKGTYLKMLLSVRWIAEWVVSCE